MLCTCNTSLLCGSAAQGWKSALCRVPVQCHLIISFLLMSSERIYLGCAALLKAKPPPSVNDSLIFNKKNSCCEQMKKKRKKEIQIEITERWIYSSWHSNRKQPTSLQMQRCALSAVTQRNLDEIYRPDPPITLAALPVSAMQNSCKTSSTCPFLSVFLCQLSPAARLGSSLAPHPLALEGDSGSVQVHYWGHIANPSNWQKQNTLFPCTCIFLWMPGNRAQSYFLLLRLEKLDVDVKKGRKRADQKE